MFKKMQYFEKSYIQAKIFGQLPQDLTWATA